MRILFSRALRCCCSSCSLCRWILTASRLSARRASLSSAGGMSRRNRLSEVARSLKGMPTASLHPSARYMSSGCLRSCGLAGFRLAGWSSTDLLRLT